MNVARRFLTTAASTSKAASAGSGPIQQLPEFVEARHLPDALYNLIRRSIAARPEGSTGPIGIRNPFLGVSDTDAWTVPISPRRQKKFLAEYPAWALPPSPLNRLDEPKAVRWRDGTIVTWEGVVPAETTPPGLYGSRRRMFKGKKHEREKPVRVQERQERLDGMPARIEQWKKTKDDARRKITPSLPF
ncbi:hypothetical protein Q8F55_007064 [Vanrija albida]|uniref:Large ribosomal subunit protein mL59 domain-containing protein n=1 Tax=Vanrija albida TaxID=181172 RepID=A0ABR3PYT7_9TREE